MSTEPLWKKVSEKKYQLLVDGEWQSLFVPYGKVEAVVTAFVDGGGLIDPQTGAVKTDILTLVNGFTRLGNILLSDFDEAGKLQTEKSCRSLATTEIIALFQIATDIISDFMEAISTLAPEPEVAEKEKGKKK